MNAIKKVRKFLQTNPRSESATVLRKLVAALGNEEPFALQDLYVLNYESFDLAIALLQDWRLDRYYASRMKLFDAAQWEEEDAQSAAANDASVQKIPPKGTGRSE